MPSLAEVGRSRHVFRAALLAIVVLAAVVRVYDLSDVPPGFFCDEAALGYNSYSILKTGRDENRALLPLYVWSFGVSYKNPIFIYASTVPIALFGLSEFSVRLTSAFFGVMGVVAIGIVGRMLLGTFGGLFAAFLLALCPWHLHFSRVAFELISLPPFVLFGLAAFLGGVRGRPTLLVTAAILFGLSLYAYVPAKAFVPLFVLGSALLYWRPLWSMRRWTALAALAGILTVGPLLWFDASNAQRAGEYFSKTTSFRPGQTLQENALRLFEQYRTFFSPSFLFERGDPIPRHSVPGFGELYWSMAPLLLLGLVWALWPRRPGGKLLIWWMILYPIAPALMNEIPSASRGIIGAPGFCLLAAAGAVFLLSLIGRLNRWPRAAVGVQIAVVVAWLAVFGSEVRRFWTAYVKDYPAQAAEAFQYGYRETIQFMEKRRRDYDRLFLTANNVNQPQIFAAFYSGFDPRRWQRVQDPGYEILDPAEFGRYKMNRSMLAALRPEDLYLFQDYDVVRRIVRPDGAVEFVIIDAKTRRRFLTDWLILGPFENTGGAGVRIDYVDPTAVERRSYPGVVGPAYWRQVMPQFVRVNLNQFYQRTLNLAGHSYDWLCAYAVTQVETEKERSGFLEVRSRANSIRAWVEGKPLSTSPVTVDKEPRRWPLRLKPGPNELLLKICKTDGDWQFTARITDAKGRDLPDLTIHPVLRHVPAPTANAPQTPRQLVDGFGKIVSFNQESPTYADYRGDGPAWWEHMGDPNGAVIWETDRCPKRVPTAFVFTAVVGDARGTAELWVNHEYALTFPTGKFTGRQRWQRGPYVLEFMPKKVGQYRSGYWILYVPEEQIVAGKPVELRVAHVSGLRHSFFMIKGRQDTAAYEKLSLQSVVSDFDAVGAAGDHGSKPPAAATGAEKGDA